MIWLHRNAAALVGLAAKDGESRYSLSCIRIVECKEDWYRLEATNGKVLGILCGPGDKPNDYQATSGIDLAAVEEAPNGAAEYLVPAKDFLACLRPAKKEQRIVVVGSEQCATFIGGNMVSKRPTSDVRFPDVQVVLPKNQPLLRFSVNPEQLILLLEAAKAVADPEAMRVEVLWYGPNKPVGVLCKNHEGQTFDGLIVPLDMGVKK